MFPVRAWPSAAATDQAAPFSDLIWLTFEASN
jgi:hypothetical protein